MKVTIMFRNNWFGGDGWTYYPVTVEISDTCPVCGARRGTPSPTRFCEDGEYYMVDTWKNECGHLDAYKDVYIESLKLAGKPVPPEKKKLSDVKVGDKFRFEYEQPGIVRTAIQVGKTEIYCPRDGDIAAAYDGESEVYHRGSTTVHMLLEKT